jgi:hypothetical protein
MFESERDRLALIETLKDLDGWIRDCLIRLKTGDEDKAQITLTKIVDTIQNPVVVENLKRQLGEMRIPF